MEIKQKTQSYRTEYAFEESGLRYAWKDSSGSRSFSVGYGEISNDRQTLMERNAWLRNVGWLWVILGVVVTGLRYTENYSLVPSIWLLLGIGCLVAYRVRSVEFVIVPSEKGNLLVIKDKDGERILREIESRRTGYFREEYDFFPESEDPEQLRRRFKWLHAEGVLTDEELAARLDRVDSIDPAVKLVKQVLASHQPPSG